MVDLDDPRLPTGDVTVEVEYSTLNYKDALAITGRGAMVRDWPLVAGIDLAGPSATAAAPDWQAGDRSSSPAGASAKTTGWPGATRTTVERAGC